MLSDVHCVDCLLAEEEDEAFIEVLVADGVLNEFVLLKLLALQLQRPDLLLGILIVEVSEGDLS